MARNVTVKLGLRGTMLIVEIEYDLIELSDPNRVIGTTMAHLEDALKAIPWFDYENKVCYYTSEPVNNLEQTARFIIFIAPEDYKEFLSTRSSVLHLDFYEVDSKLWQEFITKVNRFHVKPLLIDTP